MPPLFYVFCTNILKLPKDDLKVLLFYFYFFLQILIVDWEKKCIKIVLIYKRNTRKPPKNICERIFHKKYTYKASALLSR